MTLKLGKCNFGYTEVEYLRFILSAEGVRSGDQKLSKMRPYLIGIKFLIITDCQAIVDLNTQKNLNPQVAHWATLLRI